MKEKVFCKNCVYSEAVKDPANLGSDTLLCRLNPPMPVVMTVPNNGAILPGLGRSTSQLIAVFPPVALDTYCHRGLKKEVVT